ncbi:ABC transporter substrate-binding protein [Streptosporangium sp. 'caverna']|uniref:ABC transporter substrate-binding protein n=1 Tax=Streptosporangium sp. 'caverna' TaxID=2202249 RepID=UPI000D7E5351|nr:ABC transporter substrate-binding protein [Streptosporangium sp. 'caverna']AWS44447.1 ABC transporter substrate-binding protein [Streptosporangium sp. 'caverna']
MSVRRLLRPLALLLSVVLALTACGGGTQSATSGDRSEGGTLRWGWTLPTTWDPVTSSAGNDVNALSLVYAAITRLDDKGGAVAGLASGWKYGDGGKSVTFTLRAGLTFSDGSPLDAAAVRKSILRGRDQKDSLIASQLHGVTDVRVVSPTEFEVLLDRSDYQIPNLFAGKTGMVVNPRAFEADAKAVSTKPAGAGPFTLTQLVPGSHANLDRNPSYYDVAGIHLAKFELKTISEPATVVAGLQSGQFDVALLPAAQIDAAKAAGLEVDLIPSLTVRVLDVNNKIPPFDNPKVTEALKYAVDRKALLETTGFGVGEVNVQPFPKGHAGYNPELENLYPYDPAKARRLLAEAGFPGGIDIPLTTSEPEGLPEQVQEQLKAAGIRATIKLIAPAQHTQLVYVRHNVALAPDGFVGRESPLQALGVVYGPEGLMNPGRNTPKALLEQFDKIRTTPLDDPGYAKAIQEATAIGVRELPNVWLFSTPRIFARNPKVSALPTNFAVQRFDGVKVATP